MSFISDGRLFMIVSYDRVSFCIAELVFILSLFINKVNDHTPSNLTLVNNKLHEKLKLSSCAYVPDCRCSITLVSLNITARDHKAAGP